LVGCVSNRNEIELHDRPVITEGYGLVIVSFGYADGGDKAMASSQKRLDVALFADPVDSRENSKIDLTNFGWTKHQETAWDHTELVKTKDGGPRVIVSTVAKPGKYRLTSQRVSTTYAIWTYEKTIKPKFDLTFTVKPGEIVYLGTFETNLTAGKNLLGQAVPGPFNTRVLNEFDDDRELLYKIRPELKSVAITNASVLIKH
jgi:hypothetical protein